MASETIVIVGFCQPRTHKAAAVDDKEIFDVVALLILIQHARLRVVPHAASFPAHECCTPGGFGL